MIGAVRSRLLNPGSGSVTSDEAFLLIDEGLWHVDFEVSASLESIHVAEVGGIGLGHVQSL